MKRITWIDIHECAEQLFNVWVEQPELRWAQKSWTALEANGLTSYESEIEKCKVYIRLLVLADLYRQFCHTAYDETYDDHDLYYLCDEFLSKFKLSPFYVGQLVGEPFYDDTEDEEPDDAQLLNSGVRHCVTLLRKETLAALVKYFGSPEGLFVSLRLSKEAEEVICPDPKTLYLAGADFSELNAWEWLSAEIR
jgi:hypothetical protein